MSILAYLTGFVLGALLVLLVFGLRERRLKREHAQHARWTLMALSLVRNKLTAMGVPEDNTAMENLAAAIKTLASTAGVAPTDCVWPIKPLKQVQVTLPDGTSVMATPERAYFDAWAMQELENKLKSAPGVKGLDDAQP